MTRSHLELNVSLELNSELSHPQQNITSNRLSHLLVYLAPNRLFLFFRLSHTIRLSHTLQNVTHLTVYHIYLTDYPTLYRLFHTCKTITYSKPNKISHIQPNFFT